MRVTHLAMRALLPLSATALLAACGGSGTEPSPSPAPVSTQVVAMAINTPNSSEAQQEFVTSLFQAWHGESANMPFLSYFVLYDFDPATCATLSTYYGVSDPAFVSYLCTLGLHRSDGPAKAAWQTFVDVAQ